MCKSFLYRSQAKAFLCRTKTWLYTASVTAPFAVNWRKVSIIGKVSFAWTLWLLPWTVWLGLECHLKDASRPFSNRLQWSLGNVLNEYTFFFAVIPTRICLKSRFGGLPIAFSWWWPCWWCEKIATAQHNFVTYSIFKIVCVTKIIVQGGPTKFQFTLQTLQSSWKSMAQIYFLKMRALNIR